MNNFFNFKIDFDNIKNQIKNKLNVLIKIPINFKNNISYIKQVQKNPVILDRLTMIAILISKNKILSNEEYVNLSNNVFTIAHYYHNKKESYAPTMKDIKIILKYKEKLNSENVEHFIKSKLK